MMERESLMDLMERHATPGQGPRGPRRVKRLSQALIRTVQMWRLETNRWTGLSTGVVRLESDGSWLLIHEAGDNWVSILLGGKPDRLEAMDLFFDWLEDDKVGVVMRRYLEAASSEHRHARRIPLEWKDDIWGAVRDVLPVAVPDTEPEPDDDEDGEGQGDLLEDVPDDYTTTTPDRDDDGLA